MLHNLVPNIYGHFMFGKTQFELLRRIDILLLYFYIKE